MGFCESIALIQDRTYVDTRIAVFLSDEPTTSVVIIVL